MKHLFDFNTLDRSKRLGFLLSAVLLAIAVAVVACSEVLVHPTDEPLRTEVAMDEAEVLFVTDQMPELIGGLASIQKNLRYPELARQAGVEGRVIVQFIIDENGDVLDPKIIRGLGSGLDEAAIEAVKTARFRPGMRDGEPAKVKMSLPITFALNSQPVRQPPADVDVAPLEADVDVAPLEGDVDVVEKMPEIQGGLASIAGDIKYPELAKRAGIEGRVIVRFVVDETGAVRDASVVRGVGSGLDEEALRAVQKATFTPGEKDGQPVKVSMSLPVTFKLPKESAAGTAILIRIDANENIYVNDQPVELDDLIAKISAAGLTNSTIVSLRVDGEADMGIVSDIQEKLRNAGSELIRYESR